MVALLKLRKRLLTRHRHRAGTGQSAADLPLAPEMTMRRAVSIKDIAKIAGISPSTVSLALHHHPRSSEKRAKRICELARQMGDSPSVPARSLVTRDTATIGTVITHVSDPFPGRLVSGVQETAQANGYSVFLGSSYRNADIERNVIRDFYREARYRHYRNRFADRCKLPAAA